jgi:hypothetical protein
VGSSVRAIFSMVNLQRPARTAACAARIVPFDCDSTVKHIHTFDERSKGHPRHKIGSLHLDGNKRLLGPGLSWQGETALSREEDRSPKMGKFGVQL